MVVARSVVAAVAAWASPVIGTILLIALVVIVIIAVLAYMCMSDTWTGTAARTASKIGSFLGILDADYCKYLEPVGRAMQGATGALCALPQELARQNNVLYPIDNDPFLDELVECIRRPSLGLSVGSVFTFDEDHSICNYTRGAETCSACSHSTNSCHYGGSNGTTGSLAVDFGGNPGEGNEGAIGPQILQAAQACSASLGIPLKRATCEAQSATQSNGDNWVYCADSRADHVHISLAICSGDNGPINTE